MQQEEIANTKAKNKMQEAKGEIKKEVLNR